MLPPRFAGSMHFSAALLPDVNVRRLDVEWNKLSINQVLHGDWSFKNSHFDRHVIDSLQVFISWRQHSIAYAIRRLGQHIADDFLILPKIMCDHLCRLQAMALGPFTALGDAADKVAHYFRSFADQLLRHHQDAGD